MRLPGRFILFAGALLIAGGAGSSTIAGAGPPPPPASQSAAGVIDLPEAEVRAATDDATENLRQAILATPLSRRITVGNQLDATGGSGALDELLLHARPVGGPRWIEGTCQVQLELAAAPVADLLSRQASADPARSPLPSEVLRARLRHWAQMRFVAVGSSAGGEAIDSARPMAAGAWATVDAGACRRAVAAARTDAANRELDALAALPAPSPQFNLRVALQRPAARESLTELLCRQPVTRIEFLDDLQVSVTLAPVPQSLAAGVCQAVDSPAGGEPALSPPAEAALSRLIAARQWSCIGTASAQVVPSPAPSVLPTVPPAWVDHPLQADAAAAIAGGAPPLKVARLAERAALGRLREQFLALPLDEHRTIADAVKSDPWLAPALDRALEHAHPLTVDYRADGSVLVVVELNLRQAWDELSVTVP